MVYFTFFNSNQLPFFIIVTNCTFRLEQSCRNRNSTILVKNSFYIKPVNILFKPSYLQTSWKRSNDMHVVEKGSWKDLKVRKLLVGMFFPSSMLYRWNREVKKLFPTKSFLTWRYFQLHVSRWNFQMKFFQAKFVKLSNVFSQSSSSTIWLQHYLRKDIFFWITSTSFL